ncbi:MAG: molybdopterin-dependent oxidoreductase [Pseudomonadota bacterium]
MPQSLSFCRMCMGHCGVVVTTDDAGRLTDVRGDHDDPQTQGYACFKGMKATEAHNSPDRILQPLKKQPDGSFAPISAEQALDEIAGRMQRIMNEHGPEAIGGYKGGGGFFTSSSVKLLQSLLDALGSPKSFSSVTIDQSSKAVALGRIGIWPPGRDPFNRGDVCLLVGANPLVTVSTNTFDNRNPLKRLKAAKARGMRLIVIDPRLTETARFADVFVQPLPGEDATVLAGLLHIILREGWQDKDFCAQHAGQLEALQAAIAPFNPGYVAQRARVPQSTLLEAARVFARDASRGAATSATGPDMAPFPNLSEHLIEALNVVCGRFVREGEAIANPGVIMPRYPRPAQVMPAPRWWDEGYRSRLGDYGLIDGELPSGLLADEILTPGEGQLRCLLVHGGNPASAVPDQRKIVGALRSLELLVTIEPFMSATAQLSDYILPPTLPYERADLPLFIYEDLVTPEPYTRYTPPIAATPPGSELRDDHLYFQGLASRLGLALDYWGEPLPIDRELSTDEMLALAARFSALPFDAIQGAERGLYADEPQLAAPADSALDARFALAPEDVLDELAQVLAQSENEAFPYRLAVRRHRDALNSACRELPAIRKRLPYNEAYMNPEDMAREALHEGDVISIRSDAGEICARLRGEEGLREGVISMTHGFGSLPDAVDYEREGVNTNLLISTDRDLATINAMPRMSGIPVAVSPLASGTA